MLDADTKRRIDTARDILVGKVPDPKSQVEQITIALIYKFMDDIDAESEEWGGERSFFAGEFAQYGWARLMRSGLGGYETLNLYAEAIARMPENPGIPQLFRDIFNNAYLPYRDPETLRAFLKVIDQFSYDHSERLGDAYEYLLSVLGSQGDAGQFRTPRHIIDFIVSIVDPKKHETILDPACGTAGFLISSYRHILAANTGEDGRSTLTPDDRGRLAESFTGYDIDPGMVRLARVNMYLHEFADPHISEYDTLTSEDRWNEYADVILANPPFMTPKGGIRPHNRFSVKARRSEVLFVDYMAEHLTPAGRAGIIVPEGIIFQSQKAHKQLRKMLVEDYLVAVVSLPGGVFKPYSGVKTSILILDKSLAKRTDRIAFFKVGNDGFDLGDQRNPIDQNDLPRVQAEITEYLSCLRAGKTVSGIAESRAAYTTREIADGSQSSPVLTVDKEKIASDGSYGLSGERYRESVSRDSGYPSISLGRVCRLVRGVTYRKSDEVMDSGHQILRANNIANEYHSLDLTDIKLVSHSIELPQEKKLRKNDIFICLASGSRNHIGKVAFIRADTDYYFGGFMGVVRVSSDEVISAYLFQQLSDKRFNDFLDKQIAGTNINNLGAELLYRFEIPLPPLEVQQEIVEEIKGYQKVIDGARTVVDNYHPHIEIDSKWPMVPLGEVTSPEYGFTAKAADHGDVRLVRITDITENGMLRSGNAKFITLTAAAKKSLLAKGDVLVARTGATYGKTVTFQEDYPAVFASYLIRLRFPSDRIDPGYYWAFAQSDSYWKQASTLVTGGGQPQFNGNAIKQVRLPVPPLATQKAIVAEIETELALVDANRKLMERMERKIAVAIARVWGGAL